MVKQTMATNFPKQGDDKKISLRNSNYPLFDRRFAASIKKDDPKIWKAGGNIEGNNSYNLLLRALDGDDSPAVIRKIKEREAWAARHFEDGAQFKSGDKKARPSNIAGVVAQIKWLVIGTLGEQKMKDVILEAVKYLEDKEDRAMERQVSATVEKGLRKKVEDHNEEYGNDKRKRATYRMLRAVFLRGIGAYKTNPGSVRPSVQSPEQWAYARVNAFMFALRNLRFPSKNKFDTDLLPKAHPLSSDENGDRIQNMDTEQRHIKDIRETDESYIVEFAKAKEEKMEMDEEERPYHDDEEKRPYHDEEEEKDKKGMKDEEERAEELDQEVRDFYAEEGLRRDFEFDRNKIDEEKRTVTIGVSSEEPVQRRFGYEVLGHAEDEIDMDFMASGRSPLLLDHDASKQIGVVEEFAIDPENKRTVARVRFSKNRMADEVFEDVKDGIRQNISVGYQVNSMQKEDEEREGVPVYRVNSWSPLEVSAVSVPADQSRLVGFARAKETPKITINSNKDKIMENVENNTPEVNPEELRKQFAQEAKQISDLGQQHGQAALAKDAIAKGMRLNEFQNELLKALESKPLDLPSDVDMKTEDKREYSLLKAIQESANGNLTGLEREVSDEIAHRTGKAARGFYMPTNIGFGKRDQTVGSNSGGGFLKGTDHLANEFIEAVYAKLVIGQAGARTLQGLKGDVAIPKLSASVTNSAFVAENAAPSEGSATFAQVTMSPKTLAAFIDVSRKLMLQSDPSVEAVLREDIINTFARKIDEVAIEGGASNHPSGIIASVSNNIVGLGSNGAAIAYTNIVELIKAVEEDNAIRNDASTKFLGNSKVTAKLRTTAKQSSGVEGNFILEPNNTMLGYDYLSSSLVPSDLSKGSGSNLSALIFGDFSQVLLGYYSGVDVVVDPYTGSSAGTTRLAFFQDMDVAIRDENAFAVCKDIVTT
jgi:HK97 family phage major capsid protein/HK97 family phage prohead protease